MITRRLTDVTPSPTDSTTQPTSLLSQDVWKESIGIKPIQGGETSEQDNMADQAAHDAINALQQEVANLQGQLQQLNQQQAAPAQVQFAILPALAHQGIIDYSTSMGAKIRKAATEPLETPFDGKSSNLQTFILKQVQDRARKIWLGRHAIH